MPDKRASWAMLRTELAKSNYNARIAASRLGISAGAIYARFERRGVDFLKEKLTFRDRVKHIRAKDLRKAMIETGFNLRNLAERTGLKEATLRKRMGRLGLRKQSEPRIGWPIKLSGPSVETLKKKVEGLNTAHGLDVTVSEAIRVGVIVFSGYSQEQVYNHCMIYRRSLWRLRSRSRKGHAQKRP